MEQFDNFSSVNRALIKKQSWSQVCFTILPVLCLRAIFVACEVPEILFTVEFALEDANSEVNQVLLLLGCASILWRLLFQGHSCQSVENDW